MRMFVVTGDAGGKFGDAVACVCVCADVNDCPKRFGGRVRLCDGPVGGRC